MTDSKRKLYRDPYNAAICGVCVGIAHYFNWDVLIVRVIALLLLILFTPMTLIVYIIFRLVLPEKPLGRIIQQPPESTHSDDVDNS